MKKLVLVVAMFMFVCGNSFFAMAQDPVKTTQPTGEQTEAKKDSTSEPAKEEPKTEEPKAEEPKTEAPAQEAPATDAPASTEAPAQSAE